MARHLWPAGIHVALIIVDGVVGGPVTRARVGRSPGRLLHRSDRCRGDRRGPRQTRALGVELRSRSAALQGEMVTARLHTLPKRSGLAPKYLTKIPQVNTAHEANETKEVAVYRLITRNISVNIYYARSTTNSFASPSLLVLTPMLSLLFYFAGWGARGVAGRCWNVSAVFRVLWRGLFFLVSRVHHLGGGGQIETGLGRGYSCEFEKLKRLISSDQAGDAFPV